MRDCYIYGAGGHAKVVAACVRLLGYEIAGFVEDNASPSSSRLFLDALVLPPEKLPETCAVILAFGNCRRRLELGEALCNGKRNFPTIIHPSAQIASDVRIAKGCYIGAGVIIDPDCQIGAFSIINNAAIVCHESIIGQGCHICPSSVLAGDVRIEDCCWIGLGSKVIEKIQIDHDSFIGAGSVVVKSIPAGSLAYGVPVRIIRKLC